MSKTIIEKNGFTISRFAGPNGLRMYQITTPKGFIALNVVQAILLRNTLKAMCFDNPPCNETEMHSEIQETYK